MNVTKLSSYTKGWIIGDFEPSIFRTKDFEVAVTKYKKDYKKPPHYHKECIEYNVLIEGRVTIQGTELNPGDVFVFEKGDVADPIFHEDCTFVCVKVPSIPTDKYEVTK
jgi:quercetin dioxygenase-like cupin family protein